MKNITKLGLTALAGTLVASSAFAGSMSVSGSAKITHASADETETQGNSFSNSKGISFSGSGELDNGYTVSTSYTMTDAAFSTSQVTIDMGDMGTVGLWNGTGAAGINSYSDKVPTAGEQVWDDSDTDDNGIPNHETSNLLGYNGTFGDIGVSLAYVNGGGDADSSDSSWVVTYSGYDNLEVGVGMGSDGEAQDLSTAYLKYTMGSLTAGYQQTKVDYDAAASKDQDATHVGISIAVNESLSVSAGRQTVDIADAADDETNSGVMASYTMGSITLAGGFNEVESAGGTSGKDAEVATLNASFAF